MNKRAKTLLVFSIIAALAIAVIAFYLLTSTSVPVTATKFTNSNISSPGNITVSLVSAANISEDRFTIINISVTEANSSGELLSNITDVNITFWNFTSMAYITLAVNSSNLTSFDGPAAGIKFDMTTNGTNLSAGGNDVVNVTNTTANNKFTILYVNGTKAKPLVNSSSTAYFWFNVSVQAPGSYNITVSINFTNGGTGAVTNRTNVTLIVNDTVAPVVDNMVYTAAVYGDPDSHTSRNSTVGTGLTINSSTYANFTCNVSDDNSIINSVTLYLWQLDGGNVITNTTTTITGTTNQTNFTQKISMPGTYKWACQATDAAGLSAYSTENLTMTMNSFDFEGWVKNASNYANISLAQRADVSLFEFSGNTSGGPPTERWVKSVQTSADGRFTMNDTVSNGSTNIYRLKVTINDSAGNAVEIGPSLPPLPRQALRYAISGGSIYTQNATSIQLYAYTNVSIEANASFFGYMVMDENLGFPIASDPMNALSGIKINVSSNRNYTIMFVRAPLMFVNATPPLSIRINGSCLSNPLSACGANITGASGTDLINYSTGLITINKSLIIAPYNITACVNITGHTNFSLSPILNSSMQTLNITNLTMKMMPWSGFVPPIEFELFDFDERTSAGTIKYGNNTGVKGKGCMVAALNLSVMGTASGIEYLVEVYARDNNTGNYFGVLQNFTVTTSDMNANLTLRAMLGKKITAAGGWKGSSTALPANNASSIRVRVMDDNGTAITQGHVDVVVKNSNVFGTLHYMQSLNSEGFFYQYLINDTQEVRVRVFNQMYSPKEVKLSLTANETNITLYPFRPQVLGATGNIIQNATNSNITMDFLRYSTTCNVVDPDVSSCRIGSGSFGGGFDPLAAMMAGKSNLLVQYSSGTRVYFIDVDTIASGPPDVQLMENASKTAAGASSLADLWRFGSLAPAIYQQVWVGIPYNSTYNESWTYYVGLPLLYDHDMALRWNTSANTTAEIPADYVDFPGGFFSGGLTCSKTAYLNMSAGTQSTYCWMNTTSNMFWVRLPHFSTVGTQMSGNAPTGSGGSGTGGGAGGGGPAGSVADLGVLSTTISKDLGPGEKIKFTIGNKNHTLGVLGMTGKTVSLQFYSAVTTKIINLGETAEIDLDKDGTNDISVTVDKIDLTKMKVTLTIKPLAGVVAPTPAPSNVTEPTPTPTEPTPVAPTPSAPTPTAPNYILWAVILAAVVVVIVIAVALSKKKKKV